MHVRPFLQKQQHSNAVRSSRTSSTKLLSMLSPLTCTGACGASCSKPTAPFPSIIFRVRSFHVVSGFDCAGCNALLCRGSYNRLRGVFRLEAQDRAVLGREGSVVEEVRSRRGVAKRSVIGCTFILSFFLRSLHTSTSLTSTADEENGHAGSRNLRKFKRFLNRAATRSRQGGNQLAHP